VRRRHTFVVALEESQEILRQIVLVTVGQRADDAEIERNVLAVMLPSVATKMLPGCMSAWKKPSRKTCVKKISTPARDRSERLMPAASSASVWLIGMPRMRSITITVVVH